MTTKFAGNHAKAGINGPDRALDPLRDVKAVAEQFDCAVSTVWRHVVTGQLPAPIKIGGMTRWRQSELDAVIERAARARTNEAA